MTIETGTGIYPLSEAAKLIGTSTRKVKRWLAEDVVPRQFGSGEDDGVVTFLELLELMFIDRFRDEGVSLQSIRKAAATAAKTFNTKYPFAVKRFDTDGRTIFATLIRDEDDKSVIADLRNGQLVFEKIMRPLFRRVEYMGNAEAMRYWPLATARSQGRIVLDPQRKFGRPIDNETGVPTDVLANAVAAGDDMSTVARWFDVPKAAVEKAVEFNKKLVAG